MNEVKSDSKIKKRRRLDFFAANRTVKMQKRRRLDFLAANRTNIKKRKRSDFLSA